VNSLLLCSGQFCDVNMTGKCLVLSYFFYFILSSILFNTANSSNITKTFKIEVHVDAEFDGIPGIKRLVLGSSLASRQMILSSNFLIMANNSGTSEHSSATRDLHVLMLLIILMLLLCW